jgi:hypothetical protein
MGTPLEAFVDAFAEALVAGQNDLDEAGRASIDAFGETGIPPTVLAWKRVRLDFPIGLAVAPVPGADGADRADGATAASVVPHGGGALGISVRYLESPQGSDDPTPQLPRELSTADGSEPSDSGAGTR